MLERERDAKQTGAGYPRTLKVAHELAAPGSSIGLGSRRSTVWQLITDEERIAERTGELERLGGAPSQRPVRAKASSRRQSGPLGFRV